MRNRLQMELAEEPDGERMINARPPAVPATLNLTLAEYFSAAAVIGLLAAQHEEPPKDWISTWALDFGQHMAAEARRRRTAT